MRIETKIGIINNAEIEAEALNSLPKVKANLQVLEDILNITNNDLNLLSNQTLSNNLSQEQVSDLIVEVSEIINNSTHTVVKLRAKLFKAAAVLRMANNSVSNVSTSGWRDCSLLPVPSLIPP